MSVAAIIAKAIQLSKKAELAKKVATLAKATTKTGKAASTVGSVAKAASTAGKVAKSTSLASKGLDVLKATGKTGLDFAEGLGAGIIGKPIDRLAQPGGAGWATYAGKFPGEALRAKAGLPNIMQTMKQQAGLGAKGGLDYGDLIQQKIAEKLFPDLLGQQGQGGMAQLAALPTAGGQQDQGQPQSSFIGGGDVGMAPMELPGMAMTKTKLGDTTIELDPLQMAAKKGAIGSAQSVKEAATKQIQKGEIESAQRLIGSENSLNSTGDAFFDWHLTQKGLGMPTEGPAGLLAAQWTNMTQDNPYFEAYKGQVVDFAAQQMKASMSGARAARLIKEFSKGAPSAGWSSLQGGINNISTSWRSALGQDMAKNLSEYKKDISPKYDKLSRTERIDARNKYMNNEQDKVRKILYENLYNRVKDSPRKDIEKLIPKKYVDEFAGDETYNALLNKYGI